MKTAIVINTTFNGTETITLVGNDNPQGYDWWMYGGNRHEFPTVESAMNFATAAGNRFCGKFHVDPWGQWTAA